MKCQQNRTYADFEYAMMVRFSEDEVTEMDTVRGVRESGKRLLTMIFRRNNVMLLFLMPDGRAESVKDHEFIRYAIPKGKSLNPYTQEDVTLLMNHINSIKRP